MSRIDKSTKNQNVATSSVTKVRKKENESVSVQTNTDPWQPICRTCLQNQSSTFVFENNTIDMNEYVKAINYINAIHALINESLLSNSEPGKNSNINLKANISMPDLPNFLTLLSSISNLHNSGKSSCTRISRTTSTSAFLNKLPEQEKKTYCEQCINKYNEGEESEDPSSIKEHLLLPETQIEEIGGHGDQRPHSAEEELPDSEIYQEADAANFDHSNTDSYYIAQSEECTCKHCSKSNIKPPFEEDKSTNTQEEPSVQETKKIDQYYEVESKTNISEQEQTSIDLQRKKGTPEISIRYQSSTKFNNCDKEKEVGENKRRCFEPELSDAELDRYASELLVDVDWEEGSVKSGDTAFTFTVPINKHPLPESTKTPRTRGPSSPDQCKRRMVQQKPKEAPPGRQKSVTQIGVKQKTRASSPSPTRRNNSRSCSLTKTKAPSNPYPIRQNSPSRPIKKHPKNEAVNHIPNNEGWATVYSEKQESVKTVKTMTIAKPKMPNFQIPSLTSLEKSKICPKHTQCSSTSLTQQNHIAFQPQKKIQQHHECTNPKKTYKIQQKEDDDFICSRKSFKTHLVRKSSDDVSDKEEHRNVHYVTNDNQQEVPEIINKQKAFTFQAKGSHNNLPTSPRKSSRNDLEESIQQVRRSNERFVVSIPPTRRKRDVRNKPFRQARRQSGDSEEIVHLRDYTTPYKQMHDSDSNSNDTDGSSDIKSDKESPLQKGFITQTPLILNYANPSREHPQHKM